MDITLNCAVTAQRLDEEGEPVGKLVEIPAGVYSLRSGLYRNDSDPEGEARMWVEDSAGRLYEARGMATMPS